MEATKRLPACTTPIRNRPYLLNILRLLPEKETLASLLISGNNLTLENFYTADLGSAADVGHRFYQVAKAAAEETET